MRDAPHAGLVLALTVALAASWTDGLAQTRAGAEFQVNTTTTSNQESAQVAVDGDGDFVVVWASSTGPGIPYSVMGQRFSASGLALGGEFQADASTTATHLRPHVATSPRGDFVVVWTRSSGGNRDIQGRIFGAQGTPLGGEFAVSSGPTAAYICCARVARALDGRFVVVWTTDRDGNGNGVAARRFDAFGIPLEQEFVVNGFTTGSQVFGDVAVRPDGAFVVLWTDLTLGDGSGAGVFGQRFDASGARVGGEFQVNSTTTGDQSHPAVDVSATGSFVVVWRGVDGSGTGILARRFDPVGAPLGGDFLVNTVTAGGQYGNFEQIAHDKGGNFTVTWGSFAADGSGQGVFGQRFDAAGVRRGAEFQINSYTTGEQRLPSVGSDPVGNLVVTWESQLQDGSGTGVFGQRFGGLRPAALAVVDGGNNLLEVPDNFGLLTSWQNISGASRTFQGQGSEFTGPAGLVYTLGSTTATYGTVADGAMASCTGTCITGALLGNRPAGHVDVSVREKIVPDILGQDQRWILHVGGTFSDVTAANPFYRFVETLVHRGVTGGCGPTSYCAPAATSREQMAVFVLLAKEGVGYAPPACGATPMFADVPASSPFCRWIEELARRGVVGGCGGGDYCPSHAVTRDSMSIFVLRTLDPALAPPACGAPVFADVPAASPFCRWIEELARRGIVSGCGGGNYCPAAPVTREQIGVFLGVTFALTLYGP